MSYYDSCNRNLGSVGYDGTIRDDCNRELGKFGNDGSIRDDCNRELGNIRSDGTIVDSCNRELGRVKSDGTVVDDCNRELGMVKDDGTVVDSYVTSDDVALEEDGGIIHTLKATYNKLDEDGEPIAESGINTLVPGATKDENGN